MAIEEEIAQIVEEKKEEDDEEDPLWNDVDIEAIKKEGTNPILTGKTDYAKNSNTACLNL